MIRGGLLIVIVGGRGSGKTTYVEKLLKKRKKSIVYQLFKDDRYKNVEKKLYSDLKINEDVVNKCVVIEDATQLTACNPNNTIKQLCISCKQLGSDLILIYHSINSVPPYIIAIFDYIIFFESAKIKKTSSLAEYYDEIMELQNKKVKKYAVKGVLAHH